MPFDFKEIRGFFYYQNFAYKILLFFEKPAIKGSVQNFKKGDLVGYALKEEITVLKIYKYAAAIDTLKILLDFWADKHLFFKLFKCKFIRGIKMVKNKGFEGVAEIYWV